MYSWLIVFHIVSFVSWFAVLFYLPRLFVYHVENGEKSEVVETLKVMQHKLYTYIGIPGFWATLISGGLLIGNNLALFSTGGWLHAKLTIVFFLFGYFYHLGKYRKELAAGTCTKSGKFFRIFNEVPTVLLIMIVILVIIKPF
jgi:putative membrane protein